MSRVFVREIDLAVPMRIHYTGLSSALQARNTKVSNTYICKVSTHICLLAYYDPLNFDLGTSDLQGQDCMKPTRLSHISPLLRSLEGIKRYGISPTHNYLLLCYVY